MMVLREFYRKEILVQGNTNSASFLPSIPYLSGVEKTEYVAENNPDVIVID